MSAAAAPVEYRSVTERGVTLVARLDVVDDLRTMLHASHGPATTLYAHAATAAERPPFVGRAPVYRLTLPRAGVRAVIRHNVHGGMLAAFTGDRFLPPSNAPAELTISQRLMAAGVATPPVLAYAVYPAGLFRRADVVTEELDGGRDLGAVLTGGSEADRRLAWNAVAVLVASLAGAGARHHDLNVKNILLTDGPTGLTASVLDVDRVRFGTPGDAEITERNLARLERSARKWRELHGATVTDADLADLRAAVTRLTSSPG